MDAVYCSVHLQGETIYKHRQKEINPPIALVMELNDVSLSKKPSHKIGPGVCVLDKQVGMLQMFPYNAI